MIRRAVRRVACLAPLAALLLALIAPSAAMAADDVRVVVISSGAGDAVTAHVLSELVSLGVTVEVTPTLDGDLATISKARGAVAILRVAPSGRALRLWIAPSSSAADAAQAATEQTLDEPSGDLTDAAASLALRAVELLRARLLKLAPSSAPEAKPPGPSASSPAAAKSSQTGDDASPTATEPSSNRAAGAPPPAAPEPAARPDAREPKGARRRKVFTLALGPGVLINPGGGLSVSGAALGGVRWMFTPRVGGDVLVLAPIVPASIASPAGEVRLATTAVGAGGWISFLDESRPIAAGAGIGVAAGFLTFDAESAKSGVLGRDGTIAYALPYARSALSWRALPPVGLRADVLVGVAAPRPVIRVEGIGDAIFGRPLLAFGLGAELTLP